MSNPTEYKKRASFITHDLNPLNECHDLQVGDDLLGIPATISFGELVDPSDPSESAPAPFRTIIFVFALAVHVAARESNFLPVLTFFIRHSRRRVN